MNDRREPEESPEIQLARAAEVLPRSIHILPVTTRPFFPGQAVPLLMDVAHWKPTFKALETTPHKILGVVLASSEYALTRNYLDWLTLLPWGRENNWPVRWP